LVALAPRNRTSFQAICTGKGILGAFVAG
jgi:hypothetical protein